MSSHEVRPLRDTDIPDVAMSFNEQNDVWPGGFTRGKELTASDVQRWFETLNAIAHFVSVEDGKVRGYCNLIRSITDETDSAYIELLGVTSQYHGKGHGRDLVKACVNKAIDEGLHRVDLHTWAANMKAVPMYKKNGFMWIPDSTVLMQNFIPLIVNSPLASEFFKDIDWYKVHERDPAIVEDDETWQDMKVFTYRFKRDNKSLHVKINRYAREMVYFENDDYLLFLKPPEKKALRGRTLNMLLEIRNKNSKPVDIEVSGFGLKGLSSDFNNKGVLNDSDSLEIPFTIGHQTTKCSNYDKYPCAGVDVRVNGNDIRLALGYETKPVVAIEPYPQNPIFGLNRKADLRIELTNNAESPVSGKVCFENTEDTRIECANPQFELAVDGKASVDITIESDKSIAIPVTADFNINGETGKIAPVDIPLLIDNPFKASGITTTDQNYFMPNAHVSKDGLIMRSHSRGGKTDIYNPLQKRYMISINQTAFGPPFSPSMMEYAAYEQKILDDGWVEMRAQTDRNPDLTHVQKIGLIGGGWLCVINRIENNGNTTQSTGMAASFHFEAFPGMLSFVKDGRIISGMYTGESYPADGEIPYDASELSERWISKANWHGVWGIVFGDDVVKLDKSWRGYIFEYQFDTIEPGASVQCDPLFAYAGSGDYNTIRNGWLRLCKGKLSTPDIIENHPIRRLFTVPEIPILSDKTEIEVNLDNLRLVNAKGKIELESDDTIQIDRNVIEFDSAIRDKPFKRIVKIKSNDDSVGVSRMSMRLNSPSGSAEYETAVLRVDKTRKVQINRDNDIYVVSNGIADFSVDPSYGGGIHSFRTLDREWLKSPYPDKECPFSWYNPWRGGIRPTLIVYEDWIDTLYKEEWKLSECSETIKGIAFKGVQLSASLEKHPDLKGVEITGKFMLSEGHRILRLVYSARNLHDVSYCQRGELEIFQNVHDDNNTRQIYDYDLDTCRNAGEFSIYHAAKGWIITENIDTNQCTLVLMPQWNGYKNLLAVADHGKEEGQHVGAEFPVLLKGLETREIVLYFIACESVDEAMKLRCLLNL